MRSKNGRITTLIFDESNLPASDLVKRNWNPSTFDDRSLPRNTLSKEKELEIDRLMAGQLPEALEKLKKEKLPGQTSDKK
jgi:hypothetical protein